jgi:gliding motility-associated-like protein
LTEGINLITATASVQGCPSDASASLFLTGHAIPEDVAAAGDDVESCPGDIIIVDADDPTPSTGIWTSSSPEVVFGNANDPSTTVNDLPPGQYTLTWTLSFEACENYSSDSILVSVISTPVVFPDTVEVPFGLTEEFIVTLNDSLYGLPFTLEIVTPPSHGNALHAGNGIFRYTPNLGFVGTDMMSYRICSSVCPDECSEAIVIIKVGDEDDCFVPTLFTPNNDGVNDILVVPCLETSLFPNNSIIVFNEWGDAVFKAEPYLNDWDGRSKGTELPVGTYFYIMDFGDGSTPKRSFLILER